LRLELRVLPLGIAMRYLVLGIRALLAMTDGTSQGRELLVWLHAIRLTCACNVVPVVLVDDSKSKLEDLS
jgi:hypothetical protein